VERGQLAAPESVFPLPEVSRYHRHREVQFVAPSSNRSNPIV
jgi:hypothetical protein